MGPRQNGVLAKEPLTCGLSQNGVLAEEPLTCGAEPERGSGRGATDLWG